MLYVVERSCSYSAASRRHLRSGTRVLRLSASGIVVPFRVYVPCLSANGGGVVRLGTGAVCGGAIDSPDVDDTAV